MRHLITSRNNPKVKDLVKQKENFFFYEGDKLVNDVLEEGREIHLLIIHEALADSFTPPTGTMIRETWVVSGMVLSKLSSLKDTPRLLAVMPLEERPPDFSNARVIIGVDSLQDPGNAGTVFRCAAAFGIDGVVFTGASVAFNNNKLLRAAQNAMFRVRYRHMESVAELLTEANDAGLNVYLTSSHTESNSLTPEQIQTPCIIVLGSEGQGLGP